MTTNKTTGVTTLKKLNKENSVNDLTKINEKFADLRKAFGGNQFVLVPPWGEDPMVPKECHHNVTKIQLDRGGRSVLGFNIDQEGNGTMVYNHSVWETPQGSLMDVTLGKPIRFLPVKYFDASEEWYYTNSLFMFPDNENEVHVKDNVSPFGEEWFVRTKDWLRSANLARGCIHSRKNPRYTDSEYQDYLECHYEDPMEVA